MLLELAKPATLISSILSLFAVFHAAFFLPASRIEDRIVESLIRLLLAALVALIGGLIFRLSAGPRTATPRHPSLLLTDTLPIQLFCWATGVIVVLFLLSWYVESSWVFYKTVHY